MFCLYALRMFILQENKQDVNKRKSVDSSVKPDTDVKKAKLELKAAAANTAQGD